MDRSPASRALDRAAALLVGGALLSIYAAWVHMRAIVQAYGVICGTGSSALAHCPACYASVSLLAAGAACHLLARAADRAACPIKLRTCRSD